ncbi:hypothetical protein GobsT_50050 [Gemmata obscuriglobus]|nr:hypothetical protein GobsT_50050 [Gemmata obscuriglobus]VTS09526.1 unnamed protein product [Gemmata obscuriglobus UQM 2246]
MTEKLEVTPTAEPGTEASIRLEFEEWALSKGYSIFRKPGNPYYYEAATESLWDEYLSRNTSVMRAADGVQ